MAAAPTAALESLVVVHNVAKRHNVGTLARSATAFGVSEIVLVGRRDFNAFGSHGSTSHLRFRHFFSLSQARLYLKASLSPPPPGGERDCDICGVEITEGAISVTHHPFKKSTAFLLGNEVLSFFLIFSIRFAPFNEVSVLASEKGTGLSEKECEICDFFVYIPQYGGGTASLNVTVAASIVLHHFGVWAGFPERSREGNKFSVAEKPLKQVRRNYCADSIESVIEERKSRKETAACDIFEGNGTNDSQATNLLEELFGGEVR
ncbi:putative TrmH family tRNA/rRNA methyltransferase [Cocos nucifera]|uniref:Putative TrmH family tRNA/rRNA methyltransferase n=1 Tax=Cocos nucifera TaxID=13894 RepID=A0A8K0HT17_COCNU|nr:putative TrmH family tRNA/rRNA methyltransferase [Cocos nucifera]